MRTHTDAVFIELEQDGVTAFGEATLPPYLPYTQQSTLDCLRQIDISHLDASFTTGQVLTTLPTSIEPPARAALDMALWTLEAKLKQTTVPRLLGITGSDTAIRTYTIGVCDKEEMKDRLAFGKEKGFTTFKLKLNGKEDERMVSDFRSMSDAPFAVDANQAWRDNNETFLFAKALQAEGCLLIEQPFHRDDEVHTLRLRDHIDIPIIADEACQSHMDLDRIALGGYTGVNVKLQKCGGLSAAKHLMEAAKKKELSLLIGCMSESAIGCTAAEALSPICQWNDLDGRYLVKEVPFKN